MLFLVLPLHVGRFCVLVVVFGVVSHKKGGGLLQGFVDTIAQLVFLGSPGWKMSKLQDV